MTKKIVLFNPRPNPHLRPWDIPLAILCASRILDNEGYDIKIIAENFYETPIEEIIKQCRDAICFGVTSMTGYQIKDGIRMSEAVKERYPELPVIWGGWHVSLDPKQALESQYIDIVIKGQGERALYEVVKCIENNQCLDGILGVHYKKDGKTFSNPDRPIEDLNNFPPIPYHLVDVEKCLFSSEYGSRTLNYVSSYGCPHRCGFCCEQTVNKRKWKGLDAKRVVDDFEILEKKYKVNALSINDSNFFTDIDRVKEICKEKIKRDLKIKWGNVAGRTKQLATSDEEFWTLLRDSGCYSILTGAESGSQEMLDIINKDIVVDDILKFAEKCRQYNIKVMFSFLVGVPFRGISYEQIAEKTDEQIKLSFDLIEKLLIMDSHHRAMIFNYVPYPGTPLYRSSIELGFNAPANIKGWGDFNLYKCHVPWMLKRQEFQIKFLSSYIFMFLDSDTYDMLSVRIENKLLKRFFRIVYSSFETIAKFRFKHKFFSLPLDYYVFDLFKKFNKSI